MFNTSSIGGVIAGIFVLILAYLLLTNGDKTTWIISTIGENSIAGIKTLQGR